MRKNLLLFARWCLIAGLLVCASGCSVAPLENTYGSAPEVARAVLQALQQGDRAALLRLALSESEFRDHVWPELPAARPERNLPLDYVWTDLRQKSEASLAVTLANHAGKGYEFRAVRFLGGVTRYQTYEVHRETVVDVALPDGSQIEAKLFGSMIQKDGRWKVFSFVVDN